MLLEDKILNVLRLAPMKQMTTWQLANAIWDNCMGQSRPGNGIRVANIRMAAEKSDKLINWPSSDGTQNVGIENEIKKNM